MDPKDSVIMRLTCTIRVAKTKALISFAVTAKLICVFVCAYADCWFSHGAAHLSSSLSSLCFECFDFLTKFFSKNFTENVSMLKMLL